MRHTIDTLVVVAVLMLGYSIFQREVRIKVVTENTLRKARIEAYCQMTHVYYRSAMQKIDKLIELQHEAKP